MTPPFDPALDGRAFRTALGQFATGVTVITTRTADGPIGIVANSFASVSLDPPLVLWSPAKSSRRFDAFMAAQRYVINVLGHDQIALAETVAKSKTAVADHVPTGGAPVIAGCLAGFDCTRTAHHDAGDHVIIVGRVTSAWSENGTPLVFQGGTYGGFAPN